MKQTIYMFSAILLLMTLISALGGGLRTTENFYNEVFDLEDGSSNEPFVDEALPVASDAKDLADNSEPVSNDDSSFNEAPVEPADEVEEEFYEGFKNEAVKEVKADMNVEAYESDSFATF